MLLLYSLNVLIIFCKVIHRHCASVVFFFLTNSSSPALGLFVTRSLGSFGLFLLGQVLTEDCMSVMRLRNITAVKSNIIVLMGTLIESFAVADPDWGASTILFCIQFYIRMLQR